jgi:uncharacterized repeat protein (TIGR01451 family)
MTRSATSPWALAAVVAVLGAPALAAQPVGAAVPSAPEAETGTPEPPYTARLASCRRSLRPEGRSAALAATMRPVPGATRLAMKIELFERPLAGGPWTLRADVPGLGTWTAPSDPSLGTRPTDVYKYRQAVGRLVVQYAYRFRVGFRWLDEDGAIVREELAQTRACRQFDMRPDLTILRVRFRPSQRLPGLVRYVVVVRNDGRTSARGVTVAATLPGDVDQRTARAGRLLPGTLVELAFTGPGCAAEDPVVPSFVVDPANVVDERDETDNLATLACPVP